MRRLIGDWTTVASVIAVLALAGSANVLATSSLAVLLRPPLGIADPDRVVEIWEEPENGPPSHGVAGISAPGYCALRDDAHSFEAAAAYMVYPRGSYLGIASSEYLLKEADVTPRFFAVLRVQPAVGGASGYLLSHPFWLSAFGGLSSIVGANVLIEGGGFLAPGTVSGALPSGFGYPEGIQIWSTVKEISMPADPSRRSQRDLRMIARLRPGADLASARAEATLISRRLAAAYPDSHRGWTLRLDRIGHSTAGPQSRAGAVVWIASVLLFALSCIHSSQLLGARYLSIRRDVAIRQALGATRRHIIWYVSAESLWIATVGAAASIGLGALLLPTAREQIARFTARATEIRVSSPVVLVICAATAGGALLLAYCGFRQAYSRNPAAGLRADSRTGTRSDGYRQRLPSAVAVAFAVPLVLGAFGAVRTFNMLQARAARIDTRDLWFAAVRFPILRQGDDPRTYPTARFRERAEQVATTLALGHGVRSVSAIGASPSGPTPNPVQYTVSIDGSPTDRTFSGIKETVARGFLAATGIRLLAGRSLDDTATGELSILVNATLARRHWSQIDAAVGHVLTNGRTAYTIVGVVSDDRVGPSVPEGAPVWFRRFSEAPMDGMTILLRAPGLSAVDMNALLDGLGADLAHGDAMPANEVWWPILAPAQLSAIVMASFSLVALLVAFVGVHASTAYTLRVTRRDVGVRLALGAAPAAEISRMGKAILTTVLAGVIAGALLYAAVAGLLQRLGIGYASPGPMGWCTAVGALVTAAAVCLPIVVRLARTPPASILRPD